MAILEFWYEFASTYSYPAAMRIEQLANEKAVKVKWCPFLLGPIFKGLGWDSSPFNIYKSKGAYMWRDMQRICDEYGLQFNRSQIFPQNGLLAARLALAISSCDRPEFTRQVYLAQFARGKDIGDLQVLETILDKMNIDPATTLIVSGSDKIKTALRHNTDKAQEKQIFGSPSFITPDEELFWGNDRLEQAVAWCGR